MRQLVLRWLCLFLLPCFVQPAFAADRPNIILILTDDQGYGDLGAHGNPVIKTPNLDRLYRESVRFTDFHVSPTCSPTRCSIMTGRHEFKSGVNHTILERERMNLQAATFVQLLKRAGYKTGIFGKWHLGDEKAYRPDQRGFDEVFIHGAGGIGQSYPGSCGDAPGNSYFGPVILHNNRFEKTQGYCTDVFFGQALRWIDQVKGPEPFFAYISTNAPHSPLNVPEKYRQMYANMKLPAGKEGKKGSGADDLARFLGMVTNIDDNVGILLEKLQEWKLDENTLVIFMNDNGGTVGVRVFNAGMRGSKNTPYRGGTRGMSLWRWKGTFQPHDVDRLTAHIDLFPTLTEIAGAKVPPEVAQKLDGFSLLPLLKGERTDWPDRYLFTHVGRWPTGEDPRDYQFSGCSVRWGRYNLVSPGLKPQSKGWALYDLKADIGEQNDLSAQKPEVVAQMEKAYQAWWTEVVPLLVNEKAYQTAPKMNPFHELYWQQYQGPGPNQVPPRNGKKAGAP